MCSYACVPLEQFAAAAVVDRMWQTCHCWFIVACKLHLKHAIDMQLLWFAVHAPGSFKLGWPAKCPRVIGRPAFSLACLHNVAHHWLNISLSHCWRCVSRWNVSRLHLLLSIAFGLHIFIWTVEYCGANEMRHSVNFLFTDIVELKAMPNLITLTLFILPSVVASQKYRCNTSHYILRPILLGHTSFINIIYVS